MSFADAAADFDEDRLGGLEDMIDCFDVCLTGDRALAVIDSVAGTVSCLRDVKPFKALHDSKIVSTIPTVKSEVSKGLIA